MTEHFPQEPHGNRVATAAECGGSHQLQTQIVRRLESLPHRLSVADLDDLVKTLGRVNVPECFVTSENSQHDVGT